MASRSYVGCIKNVEIARLNFDLLRDAYGVRKGCVLEVHAHTHTHRNRWLNSDLSSFVS